MKDAAYRKIAAVAVAVAVLAAAGSALFSLEAEAFGPGRGDGWFGPDIQLSKTQQQEIARIHRAGGPMRGQRDMNRILDSLGETSDAKAIAAAREKLADKFYEDMKTHYQVWRVLTEEQRKTIETHRQSNSANREQKGMLNQEAFVRYVDKVCYLSPAQEKALASQKQEDFRRGMGRERLVLLGEKLNLTEDQEKKLTALFEETGEQAGQRTGMSQEPRFEGNTRLMNASVFDEKLAHKIAAERAEDMISGYMARQGFHQGVLDILSDEQEKQLEKIGAPGYGVGAFHRGW